MDDDLRGKIARLRLKVKWAGDVDPFSRLYRRKLRMLGGEVSGLLDDLERTLARLDDLERAPSHAFTLTLGSGADFAKLADPLFAAGCDDALLGSSGGVVHLDFDREGEALLSAVLSAVRAVESTGAQVVKVKAGPLGCLRSALDGLEER